MATFFEKEESVKTEKPKLVDFFFLNLFLSTRILKCKARRNNVEILIIFDEICLNGLIIITVVPTYLLINNKIQLIYTGYNVI